MAPVKTRLRPDGGLLLRMAATVLALAALYAAAGLVLVYAGAQAAVVVGIVAVVAVVAVVQLLLSSPLALAASGGRIISAQQAPELHAIVDRLCFQADIVKPRVAVADSVLPNAFALGRSRKGAVVCVTTGIMHLPPAELEGVVAHELSHVRNRDVLVARGARLLLYPSSLRGADRAARRAGGTGPGSVRHASSVVARCGAGPGLVRRASAGDAAVEPHLLPSSSRLARRRSSAQRLSSWRLESWSVRRTAETWASTVLALIPSRWATSLYT